MRRFFTWTPARLTGISFLFLIAIGTLFLSLPAATRDMQPASLIDALFTSVSAVCVTGLIVQDTPTYFSTFGQVVILILIQLGGLGIMTLSASLPVLFGRQIKISHRDLFQEILNQSDYLQLQSTLKSMVRYTFIIEGVGALFLTLRFYSLWGDFNKAVSHGIFHAVSAFCNAGFVLFTNNLIDYRADPVINIVIMMLIVCGGLGFVVIHEIFIIQELKKFSFHTKFALMMTGLFIFIPALFMFFAEYSNAFLHFTLNEKILASFFQVVTARTAGFNTIDLNTLGNASIFVLIILMFVGAAPGGCAGGVKVTTVGILMLSIRSLLAGRDRIELYGKRITQNQLTSIVALITIAFILITVMTILLMSTEVTTFIQIFFETVSAFGTVGLSLGLTPQLTIMGKIFICITMFIGRIGPLTLVFLIGSQKEKIYYRYPKGKIMLG